MKSETATLILGLIRLAQQFVTGSCTLLAKWVHDSSGVKPS